MRHWFATTLLALVACGGKSEDTSPPGTTNPCEADDDADGVCVPDDCDDADENAYPGATEVPYDGKDQDCDGFDITDYDGDGYDAVEVGGDDCNDGNVEIYPGAPEECYDALQDYNCDGRFGGDDCDGDGVGRDDDCLDEDPTAYPGAADAWYDGVDSDCAGNSDYDQDADGDDHIDYGGLDCDDTDPLRAGASPEQLDAVDNDCDGDGDVVPDSDADVTWDATSGLFDYAFGSSTVILGDLDGDGWSEVAMGDIGRWDGGKYYYLGGVYVVSPALGSARPYDVAGANIGGTDAYDSVGWAVGAADAQGDGTADLIVGAPFLNKAYLFTTDQITSGDAFVKTDAHATLTGGSFAGAAVGGVQDLDGDGLDELFSAATLYSTAWVGVWSGAAASAGGSLSSGGTEASVSDGGRVLGDVASEGDLNGDGVADLLLGVPGEGGRGGVFLLDGLLLSGAVDLDDADSLLGPNDGADAGVTVSVVGDADGDGVPEVAAADPFRADSAGAVWIVSASAIGGAGSLESAAALVVEGAEADGMLRVSHRGGDVDGDGAADLGVGEPGSLDAWSSEQGKVPLSGYGAVHLVRGITIAAGGTVSSDGVDGRMVGDEAIMALGMSFDVAPVNPDGAADFVVGATNEDSGKGYVFLSAY
jgi:hypothetical protein